MLLNRFTRLFDMATHSVSEDGLRYGQALMLALHTEDKDAYFDIITGKPFGDAYKITSTQGFQRIDPFYDDSLIPIFLAHLAYRWGA